MLLSEDLEATQAKVEAAGGIILQGIFDFPGGQRFHFTESSGNELAVWCLPEGETQKLTTHSKTSQVEEENFRLIVGFSDVFIVIDRCAFMVSSLAYVIYALGSLVGTFGSIEINRSICW